MRKIFAAALLLLGMSQNAWAQESQPGLATASVPADGDDALQREVEALKVRLAALENNRGADAAKQTPSVSEPLVVPAGGEPLSRWSGGASLFVLKPVWSTGNTAFVTESAPGGFVSDISTTNFHNGYQAAPGAWVEFASPMGFVIRADFLQFNQSATSSATGTFANLITDPSFQVGEDPGDTISASSSLAINYLDLEATKMVELWDMDWTVSAGLRYLYLNQTYQAIGDDSSVSSRQSFNGVGPTISLQGRCPIGGSGLGFYAGGRGSLVLVKASQDADFTEFGLPLHVGSDNWGVVPIIEAGIGIDFRRSMGRSTLVANCGFIGQAYFGVGAPGPAEGVEFNEGGQTNNGTLGMFGLQTSISLEY